MENLYIPEKKKILFCKKESSDSFTLRLDWKLKHEPGQFVMVSVPGYGECPISICSYSEDYVELNVRLVGDVTNALSKLKKNRYALVRGPYGKGYPMEFLKGNNIIIVGGGCGIAPLKGVIEFIGKNRRDYKDVLLYLGFRTAEDILFEKHLKNWEKQFNLNVSFDKDVGKSCFDGKIGFVTQLIEQAQLNNQNKVVFICGPPVMIQKTVEIFKKKGFNDDQIFVSMERKMQCGIGVCGHCMIRGKYVCKDGPVIRYDEISMIQND